MVSVGVRIPATLSPSVHILLLSHLNHKCIKLLFQVLHCFLSFLTNFLSVLKLHLQQFLQFFIFLFKLLCFFGFFYQLIKMHRLAHIFHSIANRSVFFTIAFQRLFQNTNLFLQLFGLLDDRIHL